MSQLKVPSEIIYPGGSPDRPPINDCQAGEFDEIAITASSIRIVDPEFESFDDYGQRIKAVVGPFNCNLCDHQCELAFGVITLDAVIEELTPRQGKGEAAVVIGRRTTHEANYVAKAPSTSPNLPTRRRSGQTLFSQEEQAGMFFPGRQLKPHNSDWKVMRDILNDMIDLHFVDVSVGEDGEIAQHPNGFGASLEKPDILVV